MKAKIYNLSFWFKTIFTKKDLDLIENCLKQSGFQIINFIDYEFKPYGYTCIWLLAESHCAIHTFPEERKVYLEISSCSKRPFTAFSGQIRKSFNIKHI